MILHLLTDEAFTDYAIQHFSTPESLSEFVLIPSNNMMECVSRIQQCRVIHQNSTEFEELLSQLGNYDAIILHGMHWSNWETPVLKFIPDHVKVAWNLWGGDIYGRSDIKNTFQAPLTKIIAKLHHLRCPVSNDSSWEIDKALFQRVDYCLTDELEEFEYVRKYTSNYRMKMLWYAYFSIEKTVGGLMDKHVVGNNIWLGNCAEVDTNLFDALLRLKLLGVQSRKIICPLSYSTSWIRTRVNTIGKWLFGNSFVPLNSYMKRDEYNNLMLDCGTMIMPPRKPQGHGNILTGLWLGMRVYMSEHSIAYDFFKRIGTHVYSWESEFRKYRYTPMTDAEVEENRVVLMKWYGYQHIEESVPEIVRELIKHDE